MVRLGGISFLAIGAFLSLGCSGQRSVAAAQMNATTLENVQWTLLQIDGEALKTSSRGTPTMSLKSKDRRMSGFAGCNRMMSGYELDGEALKFDAMATT